MKNKIERKYLFASESLLRQLKMLSKTLPCLSTKLLSLSISAPISTPLSWTPDTTFQPSFLEDRSRLKKHPCKCIFFIQVKYPKQNTYISSLLKKMTYRLDVAHAMYLGFRKLKESLASLISRNILSNGIFDSILCYLLLSVIHGLSVTLT